MSAPASGVSDQAEGLRRLLMKPAARTLAVFGMHRLAGATTVAMGLAAALARAGREVVLLERAARSASRASTLWNVVPPGNFSDVLTRQRTRDAAAVTAACGVRVLPASTQLTLPARSAGALCPGGIVVFDVGLGHDGSVPPIARDADHWLVVFHPETDSVTQTYAGIKRLCELQPRPALRLLLNRATQPELARRLMANLLQAGEDHLGLRLRNAGAVRHDPQVAAARAAHRTVVEACPQAPASEDLRQVAAVLQEWLPDRAALTAPLPSVPSLP